MALVKKQKNAGVINDIHSLHACISKNRDQLDTLYKKTFVNANKSVLAIKKSLAKVKKQAIKAKTNRKNSPKAYQIALSEIQSLQKQLTVQKEEQDYLESAYTKFNAQQKVLFKFEKEWNKKIATPKKKPKKRSNMIEGKVTPEIIQMDNIHITKVPMASHGE